jgi:mono/diheme cytochrome c family protein
MTRDTSAHQTPRTRAGRWWVVAGLLGALACLAALAVAWSLVGQQAAPAPTTVSASASASGHAGAISVPAGTTSPAAPAPADVEQGAYLALLGNCAGCHTAPGGAAYAGGRAIPTPFGAVYAGNLTPDDTTGLGRWTADSFWRALHEGRSHDGRRLIPAFPYTAYTQVTRPDSDRLFAYLRSLPPVRQAPPPHDIRFPFGTQPALAVWQWLYFRPGTAPASAAVSATRSTPAPQPTAAGATAPLDAMARGAYLVNALGHCAECHAPRNRWGALGTAMTGGVMPGQNWYAPSLHPVAEGPGAQVTAQDLVDMLRSGGHRHGSASGPMAGVVFRSTQFWSEADLQAVAAHLTALPAQPALPTPQTRSSGPVVAAAGAALGQRLYADRCAECHGDQGQGVPGRYAPLAGNPSVTQPDIRNLVQMLQHGGFAPATRAQPRPFGMPPQDLSVAETTAVLNHLRQSWGHRAPAVDDVDVVQVR